MNEPLQQSTAQGLNEADPAENLITATTITFELHAKMAKEIDLEKCNFRNFGSSVTLTLTLDRVKVTSSYTVHVGLPVCPTM